MKCANFFKINLSRSNFSTPTKNTNGQPSNLNLYNEKQGQIHVILCKTHMHSVIHKPLTVE